MAARFNPAALAGRIAERKAEQKRLRARFGDLLEATDKIAAATGEGSASAGVVDEIDGRKSPELFFPTELFTILIEAGYPPSGSVSESRQRISERAAALGFGRDLWPRLASAAAPFLKLRRERDRLAAKLDGSRADDSETWCRKRAEALAAAKAEFGEELFLRLLYEAVAPTGSISYVVSAGEPAMLRSAEWGCR
jgi:hypothetical protein